MFKDLNLPESVVHALESQGFTTPFEIQADVIPAAVEGDDILAKAPTGSGKTLAFGIPMIVGCFDSKPRKPKGLVISPTRELAEQIKNDLGPIASEVETTVTAVYGGAPIKRQIQRLDRGVDILVACPGRLLDLMEQGKVKLDELEIVTIDEADQLCDMGFLPDIKRIMNKTPKDAQVLLFSATLDKEIQALTKSFQTDPVQFDISDNEIDVTNQNHQWLFTPVAKRASMAAEILKDNERSIVFVRTKRGAERLAKQLSAAGIDATSIHGDKSQRQRHTALEKFKDGDVTTLVATDVAARGIHVDNIARVLNFDVAADHKDYVHRSGRTARAGNTGDVITFVRPEDKKKAKYICKDLGISFDLDTETAENHTAVALPVPKRDNDRKGNSRGGSRDGGRGGNRGRNSRGRGGQSRGDGDYKGDRNRKKRKYSDSDSESESTGSSKPRRRSSGSENDVDPRKKKGERSGSRPSGKRGPASGKKKGPKAKSSRTGKPRPKNKNSARSRKAKSSSSRG